MTPLLHVSQRYPASRLCAAPVIPLSRHPRFDNRVIVFDLEGDADALLQLDAEGIADRLYTPAADLPPGEKRVPLKEVHLNRSPALVAWSHLREEDFSRLQINRGTMEANAAILRQHGAALAEKVRRVYANEHEHAPSDVDASVYDGFIADGDKQRLGEVRSTPPAQLGERVFGFKDTRLDELLFRYRARNWPQTLTLPEQQRWDEYRRRRLSLDVGLSEYTFESWQSELDGLCAQYADDGGKLVLLDQLQAWGNTLQAGLS